MAVTGPATHPEERRVEEAVRQARSSGSRIRVRGGGASAVPPRAGEVGLDLRPLRGIVDLRPTDLVVTVLAGTPLADLAEALRETGRRLPLEPWAPPGATVGGAVAAAADGLTARNTWRWRDHVLGATAVLGTGERVTVGSSVVKSVAGFDVARALVGSRGTLAVLTRLCLRLEAIPGASVVLVSPPLRRVDVASAVAPFDAFPWAPVGLVATSGTGTEECRVHARFDGPRSVIAAAALRLETAGFLPVEDGARLWARMTAAAAAPAPPGTHRRVTRCDRGGRWEGDAPSLPAGPGCGGAGGAAGRNGPPTDPDAVDRPGWVCDLLRGRVTWIAEGPPPAPEAATAALAERVRRAFDPDGVLAPGRGLGAP